MSTNQVMLTDKETLQFKDWIVIQHKYNGKPTVKRAQEWIEDLFNKDIGDHVEALIKEAYTEATANRNLAIHDDLEVPGLRLPLDHFQQGSFPILANESYVGGNPIEFMRCWNANTLLIREVCMLKLMEELTNKPEWWLKVRDPKISSKWKAEALAMDWEAYRTYADFTDGMAEACIDELLQKADLYEQTGLIPVMDYSACVIKSDKLVPEDLKQALIEGVKSLEDVLDDYKDWHPGSDGKVLNLVHPSLWPLLYGRSRVLLDKRIDVSNALEHCGMGDILSESHSKRSPPLPIISSKFQWLPCDVILDGGKAKIDSYINNLHPVDHAHLYPIIERFIEKALPAWDIVYRWPSEFETQRLTALSVGYTECNVPEICDETDNGCDPKNRPLNEGEPERYEDLGTIQSPNRDNLDREWFKQTHDIELPDIQGPNLGPIQLQPSDVRTSGFFYDASRIQVIVKLANIHLTPEKPSYDGGSWHTEGLVNEHICSTALFYYDSDNITECHLDFRTVANSEDLSYSLNYEQCDYAGIMRTFALHTDDATIQDIGSVLTRPDRALFFPNLYQHHVSPFRLADPSRPGYRKILALFLVDPANPVLSTARVPPQQRHWWSKASKLDGNSVLPPELTHLVVENMEFPLGEDEAKKIREELMAERTVFEKKNHESIQQNTWNFCEH